MEGLFSVFTYTHTYKHLDILEFNSTFGLVRTLLNHCCQLLTLRKILCVALLITFREIGYCKKNPTKNDVTHNDSGNRKDHAVKVLSRSLEKLTEKQKTLLIGR